jgi:hypothetical protein
MEVGETEENHKHGELSGTGRDLSLESSKCGTKILSTSPRCLVEKNWSGNTYGFFTHICEITYRI